MSAPHVVVVLNWHGREDTLRCVESLRTGSPDATVLVVDNGSYDGALEEVARRWPEVHTLQTGYNLGFAGGMNAGIRWALRTGALVVTVLNNDTIVPPGAIVALEAQAGTDAAVSPVVRYTDPPGGVWFGAGLVDRRTGLARHLSDTEIATTFGLGSRPRDSEILAGCCLTASAGVWRRVGGFDERYFLMFEDSDWSVRAAQRGVRLLVDPAVEIRHRVSASFVGAASYLGSYYYARNGLLFSRTRTDLGALARLRFLRHHVLPPVLDEVRRRDLHTATRRAIVVLWALAADLVRRYGPAPRALQRVARSWSRTAEAPAVR